MTRPVRLKRPKPKRGKSDAPADTWLKEKLKLKRENPEKYERETKDALKLTIERYERLTKGEK